MAAIGSALATLHAWVATAGAVLAGLLLVLGMLDGAGVVRGKRWLDRLILGLVGALLFAALLGPGIVFGVRPPSDPLHFLYAAVAILAAPASRLVAVRRNSVRVGWWVASGGLVTLGALLRLWGTGG